MRQRRAGTPVAKDRRKLVTRARILEAAFEQFAQHGFAAATVRHIATDAGVSHPAIYWHFGSKSGVYAEAVRIAGERFLETLPKSTPDVPFCETATAWIRHLAEDAPIARLLRSLGADHRHPTVDTAAKSVNTAFRDFWRAWIRARDPAALPPLETESDRLAHAIVATLTGMALVKFDDDPEPPLTSLAMLSQLVEHN